MKRIWNWIKAWFKSNCSELPTTSPPIVITQPDVPAKEEVDSFPGMIKPGAHGIDISHHNTNVDFSKIKQDFIFLKATEGETFIDSTFKSRWEEVGERGIVRGAYHFYRANKDPIKQARHFCKVVGTLKDSDMLVLDMETTDGVSASALRVGAKLFLETVEALTGKVCIIYSGHYFLVDLKLDETFKRYPLWLARYTSVTPVPPRPWTEWTFWQYSETAIVEGVGKCDVNHYKKS